MKDLTIIIKTYERKNILIGLLESIEKYYPDLPIIIVDDSKVNYKNDILKLFPKLNINYIVEDYNIGLSKGRNILLKNVKTKYFLLCDDDYQFDERTNLNEAMKVYKKNKIDILGGCVYNRYAFDTLYTFLWSLDSINKIKKIIKHEEFLCIYNGEYNINDSKIELSINKNFLDYSENKIYKTDICSNFFIGNTKKINEIGGWGPEILKMGEHEFFFLKCKVNNLKVYFTPIFGVCHYPKKSISYLKYRFRDNNYFKEACKMSNIERFYVHNKNTKIYLYEEK